MRVGNLDMRRGALGSGIAVSPQGGLRTQTCFSACRALLFGLLLVCARNAGAQPTPADPPADDLSLNLSADRRAFPLVVSDLAAVAGKSCVVAFTDSTPRQFAVTAPLAEALAAVSRRYGAETAMFRGCLVGRAASQPLPPLERLRAALQTVARVESAPSERSAEEREGPFGLLSRLVAERVASPAGGAGAKGPAELVQWYADRELRELCVQYGGLLAGHALVGLRAPVRKPSWDYAERLLVSWPHRQAAERAAVPPEEFWVGYDRYREFLAANGDPLPLAVYKQRCLTESREQEDWRAEDARLNRRVSVAAITGSIRQVTEALSAASSLAVTVADVPGDCAVALSSNTATARTLLLSLAAACGLTLEGGPSAEEYRLRPPQSLSERILATMPLTFWSTTSLSTVESDLLGQESVEAFWNGLEQATRAKLRTSWAAANELGASSRQRLAAMVEVRLAWKLSRMLRNLARAELPGGVRLEESPSGYVAILGDERFELSKAEVRAAGERRNDVWERTDG